MSSAPADLHVLRNSYAAALVASVTYGFYAAIFLFTTHALIVRPRGSGHKLNTRLALGYVALMFIVQTVYYCAGSKWSAIEFVEVPAEGPAAFATQLSTDLALLKNTMYTINIWLADGFIVWRCFVVYSGRFYAPLVPGVVYLASIATGIGLLVETSKPGAAFGQAKIIDFGTPFWSLSVGTNVIATLLIAGRLMYRRGALHKFNARAGGKGTSNEVAILAESAALYAVVAIIYIPLFAKNLPTQFPFSALLVSTSCIATNLIILRMAKGLAITRDWAEMELPVVARATATETDNSSTHKEPPA
ncbi:hypothetical protein AURDEDRAFT_104716 [Auricularia subglabra TFB-10046 SS5]|nr:hypothetical protein AURDEDRAFT_104716 [Auricularia subglabra TFB-10046 SS5]